MELTGNDRTIYSNLEVSGDLILVTFDCSITSKLCTNGTMSMLDTQVLE